ncbi:MAG: flagellar biosynthesis protein FlhF [Mycobacterium leprae]
MMRVKKYTARSLAEAIIQAKQEMGREAFIVDSRKVKVGGILGFFGRTMTEVTVAVDDKPAKAPEQAARPIVAEAPSPVRTSVAVAPPIPTVAPRPAVPEAAPPVAGLSGLEREVQGLRVAVARLMEHNGSRPELKGYCREVFDSLLAVGVDEEAAAEISQRVPAEGTEGPDVLRKELKRLLGPGVPIEAKAGQRRIVAMVGPTGVGKTTTLAKLAARFTLERGLKVALITSDTFRIAAIDQLRTYADILNIPLFAVDTTAQVAEAVKATVDYDLVLVDTGGRNHRDPARMEELRDFLAVLRPDETHLVVALTTNPRDVMECLDYYLPLGVNRLTFTKLDEATSPGLMLNVRLRSNQPVSYLTNGQSVPDDITPADEIDFTKILLGA